MSLNVSPEAYERARKTLQAGGVIAYPTEAVYGLGCDPFNEQAVTKLLTIKQRAVDKGLILIAANWEQIAEFCSALDKDKQETIKANWPGPITYVVPLDNNTKIPKWISGSHNGVALRVTAHVEASKLCELYGGPIVSTSANKQNEPPVKDNIDVYQIFGDEIDYILPGRVGDLDKPTIIRSALDDSIIRN